MPSNESNFIPVNEIGEIPRTIYQEGQTDIINPDLLACGGKYMSPNMEENPHPGYHFIYVKAREPNDSSQHMEYPKEEIADPAVREVAAKFEDKLKVIRVDPKRVEAAKRNVLAHEETHKAQQIRLRDQDVVALAIKNSAILEQRGEIPSTIKALIDIQVFSEAQAYLTSLTARVNEKEFLVEDELINTFNLVPFLFNKFPDKDITYFDRLCDDLEKGSLGEGIQMEAYRTHELAWFTLLFEDPDFIYKYTGKPGSTRDLKDLVLTRLNDILEHPEEVMDRLKSKSLAMAIDKGLIAGVEDLKNSLEHAGIKDEHN